MLAILVPISSKSHDFRKSHNLREMGENPRRSKEIGFFPAGNFYSTSDRETPRAASDFALHCAPTPK
jgi:hypothetical protein